MRRAALAIALLAACGSKDKTEPAPKVHDAAVAAPSPADAEPRMVLVDDAGAVLPPPRRWPNGTFQIATELPEITGGRDLVGLAGAVLRFDAARDGRWAVFCQAREDTNKDGTIGFEREAHFTHGDRAAAYVVLGAGPGAKIDALLAVSPDERYLVLELERSAILLDTRDGTAIALPGGHTSAGFSDDGAHLAYLRDHTVVVREVATGKEREAPRPDGWVGEVTIDRAGRWARLDVERRGPSGHRMPDHYPRSTRAEACDMGLPPDHVSRIWIDVGAGVAKDAPELLAVVGDHTFAGKDNQVAIDGVPFGPADCDDPELHAVSGEPTRAILRCSMRLYLVGPGLDERVSVTAGWTERRSGEGPLELATPAFCTQDGGDEVCVDLATGAITKEPRPGLTNKPRPRRVLIEQPDGRLRWTIRPD